MLPWPKKTNLFKIQWHYVDWHAFSRGERHAEKLKRPISVVINCQICLDYDQCLFWKDSGLSKNVVYCLFQLIAIPKAKMMPNNWTCKYQPMFCFKNTTRQGLRQGADGRVDGNRFGPQLPLYQALQDCQRLLPFQGLFTGGQQRVEGHYVLRYSGFFWKIKAGKTLCQGFLRKTLIWNWCVWW